jgi:hypothetical protein
MDICLLCVCYQVDVSARSRSLVQRVLLTVLCRCVWSRNVKNEAIDRVGPQRHRGKKYSNWMAQLPDNIYCGALGGGGWHVRGNRAPSITCPPQVLWGLPWDLITVSAVRWRPTGLNHGAAHVTFAVSFGRLVWMANEVIKDKLNNWVIYLQRICAYFGIVRIEVRSFEHGKDELTTVHFPSNYIRVYMCTI